MSPYFATAIHPKIGEVFAAIVIQDGGFLSGTRVDILITVDAVKYFDDVPAELTEGMLDVLTLMLQDSEGEMLSDSLEVQKSRIAKMQAKPEKLIEVVDTAMRQTRMILLSKLETPAGAAGAQDVDFVMSDVVEIINRDDDEKEKV